MAELLVWIGGDRNVLDPFERLDGMVSAIKPDGHVWGSGDLANHGVIKISGAAMTAVEHLLLQKTEGVDRTPSGRRAQICGDAIVTDLKADSIITRNLGQVISTMRGQ